jgi:hypothetical protein
MLLAERHPVWFDIIINIAHFMKAVSAVMLKSKMLDNKRDDIKMNPTYLLP